jgi:dynein heavy chain
MNWKDELKKIFKLTGIKNTPTCLFLSESHLIKDTYFEDINNIMTTGEVPNLL